VDFNGVKTYKGYSVAVYTIVLDLHTMQAGQYRLDVQVSGEEYVYAGFPVDLYGSVQAEVNAETLDGRKLLEMRVEVKLDTVNFSIPATAPHAYTDQGSLAIIAGGLPGAKLVVKGVKGENKLVVTNNGTSAGYITVVYREAGSKSSLASPSFEEGISTTLKPLEAGSSIVESYAVKPGESKTIVLRASLAGNVDLVTTPGKLVGIPAELVFTAVVAVTILAPVIAIYWLLKKSS